MTKIERVRRALEGKKTDHIPFSFWTHMAGYDLDPELLARKTAEFAREYDIDFVKTMNNGMYSVEDYGCELDQSQVKQGGVTKLASTPVSSIEDWKKIGPLDIHFGALNRELTSLKLLQEETGGQIPVVFTVMSPMTTAEKLTGGEVINHLLSGHEDKVLPALKAITDTTCALAREAIRLGAAGIFFASQIEYYGGKDDAFCEAYEKPFDLQVLRAAEKGWFNVIHAHGSDIMFDILKDYPVHAFNWHVGESLPQIEEARDTLDCALMGGLNRADVKENRKTRIHNQIYRIIKATNGRNILITPGCVVRLPLNQDALHYVRDTIWSLEQKLDTTD